MVGISYFHVVRVPLFDRTALRTGAVVDIHAIDAFVASDHETRNDASSLEKELSGSSGLRADTGIFEPAVRGDITVIFADVPYVGVCVPQV